MLSRPVLLYDGSCGFCRRWVRRLRRWDRRGVLQLIAGADQNTGVKTPADPSEFKVRNH